MGLAYDYSDLEDLEWLMVITIASGCQAWVTPEDYLPSGTYIYTDWWEGDRG